MIEDVEKLSAETKSQSLSQVKLPLGQAQSTNASLAGRITDPADALIVDARVAAISAATNLRYEDITNGSGEYHLANLPPASYRLEI